MSNELAKAWNKLERLDKLEIIADGIDMCDVTEGFLMLRLYRDKTIEASIQKKLDNHLCTEAVSQATLSGLFSDTHEFEEEDAEVILQWMESQK